MGCYQSSSKTGAQTQDPSALLPASPTLKETLEKLQFLKEKEEKDKEVRYMLGKTEILDTNPTGQFIYLGFYVTFNTVQVISRWVVGRAEETST